MKEQMTKIKSILNERLVKYGFKKRGYDYFVRMADEDIIQNIGFGIATYGEKHVRYLNPSIGITSKEFGKNKISRICWSYGWICSWLFDAGKFL